MLIPVYGADGKVWTLEAINPDGEKDYLKGGRKRGGFHPLGKIHGADRVLIGEGLATVAAVYALDNAPAVAAMDAGNIQKVVICDKADIQPLKASPKPVSEDTQWNHDAALMALIQKSNLTQLATLTVATTETLKVELSQTLRFKTASLLKCLVASPLSQNPSRCPMQCSSQMIGGIVQHAATYPPVAVWQHGEVK